ncbi:MAG: ThuA domain-containing protein [Bacteroidia bacterium]|nr:ThuA domain-containing protein [Bacteroidia bacterium]
MHSNLRSYFNNPFLLLFLVFTSSLQAQQFRLLLYTETGGYNHGTEAVTKVLLDSLGTAHSFSVDLDNTGDTFTELDSLLNYEIILWANTSGANILDSTQRSHFEKYMAAGGNMMGIHAATDTYRHSSANGGWTGQWDYYAETIGASVQTSPNHTWNLHSNFMDHTSSSTANDNLPDPWEHAEEYYYWENGYFDTLNNHVLLKVRTTDRGGSVSSYDSARAVSWVKDDIGGGKVFYTSLGHNRSSYENDQNFKIHLRDAILLLSAAPPPVLGVNWSNLSLERSLEGNRLNWTAELTGSAGNFMVERRSALGFWAEVTQMDILPGQNRYSFIDKEGAEGNVYYRIAFMDLEGEISYSRILKLESLQPYTVLLGNPVLKKLQVAVEHNEQGLFQLEIINLTGAEVLRDQFFKEQDRIEMLYDLEHLPSGMYLLKISSKDYNFAQRISKI